MAFGLLFQWISLELEEMVTLPLFSLPFLLGVEEVEDPLCASQLCCLV